MDEITGFKKEFRELRGTNAFRPDLFKYQGLQGRVWLAGKDFSTAMNGSLFADTFTRGIRIIIDQNKSNESHLELVTGTPRPEGYYYSKRTEEREIYGFRLQQNDKTLEIEVYM